MGARSAAFESLGDDFAWALLDAAPDATVIVAAGGQIVAVNDHAGELFGFGLEDLLGRVVEDLLAESLRGTHRAHRTRYRAEPTVRTMGVGLELRARRCDGSEFPVEISLSPLRVGRDQFTVAAVRDISHRVAAEERLHRVMQTLDASDDGIFVFDLETLRYAFVNDGAIRLSGYEHDELLAMTPLHLNPEASKADYDTILGPLLADLTQRFVRPSTLIRKDGTQVAVETTFKPVSTGRDGATWVIALARDVSARLAAEEELRASQDELRKAAQIVELAADRERIARDLHDTVIQQLFGEGLNLQAALGTLSDDQTRARIETTIEGLDDTIKNLRSAIFSLQTPSARPDGLRGRLLDVVTHATDNLGFEPRLQFDGPLDTVDDRLAGQLVPVLREALSNIAQHAGAHHVRVSVSVTDELTLTVADDGGGMPDEVLGGNGLTNMAHRARALGGNFRIGPQPGGGSVLVWHVPAGA